MAKVLLWSKTLGMKSSSNLKLGEFQSFSFFFFEEGQGQAAAVEMIFSK